MGRRKRTAVATTFSSSSSVAGWTTASIRVSMNASARTGEYHEKSFRKRCWAAGSTRTCLVPTTAVRESTSSCASNVPSAGKEGSVKDGDGLDLAEEPRLVQALYNHQCAGH